MDRKKTTKTAYLANYHRSMAEKLTRINEGEVDDRSLKDKLRAVTVEVAEFSLFAGISNIVRSELQVKLTWIFFHLLLLAAAMFLVVNNVINYLQFDVSTQVREINEFPIEFPTVTLCNLNVFQNTDASVEYLREIAKRLDLPDPFNPTDRQRIKDLGIPFSQYAVQGRYDILLQNFSTSTIQSFGYTLSRMFFSCSFDSQACNYSKISWFFHRSYGNCYQFNTGHDCYGQPTDLKKGLQTGAKGGLTVELFVGLPAILEQFTNNIGLTIFIHTNTTSPLSIQPVTVKPNTETNIVINRIKTEKQPQPYSSCRDLDSVDSELKDFILNQGIDYHQQDCIKQCNQKLLIENCQCFSAYFENYIPTSVAPCDGNNQTQNSCFSKIYNDFFSDKFIEVNCFPLCPLECTTIYYQTAMSFNAYPTPSYESQLLDTDWIGSIYQPSNFTQPLRNNILKVNIYFDSLSYTHIAEAPAMDWITLVSNMGGSVGIMLGVSLATLIEFIELLVKMLIVTCKHRKQVKKKSESSSSLDFKMKKQPSNIVE